MSLPLEESDRSYLTDEVLQEVFEYEGRHQDHSSNHWKGEEQEGKLQHENFDSYIDNDIISARGPLVTAQHNQHQDLVNDGNHSQERMYFSPWTDDHSLATTTKNEGGGLNQKLCWRLDPSQSLSDWELHIYNRSTKKFKVYHVHRVVLALGPRGCAFFQDVFRKAESGSSPSTVSGNKRTMVPLVSESCQFIGCFLDHIYGNEQFKITYKNALGLCYLADYFRNNSLWELATDFIEEDLGTPIGLEHLSQYYTDSIYYDQDEFLDHILAVCSKELLRMMEDGIPCTKLLMDLTPAHFETVLVDMELPTEEDVSSCNLLTRLITQFLCMHEHDMSVESFVNFTSQIIVLNSSSAIMLLEASIACDFGAKDSNQKILSNDSDSSLILFQQRCIESLSEEWEELLELDQGRVTEVMRTLSLREEHIGMLVDWFQKTLKQASSHLLASRQETERVLQQKLCIENRCEEMAEELDVAQEETAVSQRNHNTTKSEMKTQISSWMRKNEGTNQLRQAEQQQWDHERLKWQIEIQQWKHEKSKMKREIRDLRRKLSLRCAEHQTDYIDDESRKYAAVTQYDNSDRRSSQVQDRPFVIPDDYESDDKDDSRSYVTDSSEENSLLNPEDAFSGRRDPHAYPMSNGMSPQFRIF
mmetsp:Transcript_22134/g.52644  ORF Transcript_22134/g.52644 Transcript_22134/m.52644 type:complete len:644 (+) Transcript_22134:160-2091(+)|eukprot:CAMPEP_0197194638 /NCGR_PEP_ID=MMETSP1423-20130617/29609_1 /TAXON_ID=476441 /ORGANISM="Pseudo-nitzschia heimii, Strain UNC1101" /LENGTH=643 /DNA_ID=CAMNT_0042648091 /DNA_START=80 /DNA_END=2011 /DNA_ORIENTATION=+